MPGPGCRSRPSPPPRQRGGRRTGEAAPMTGNNTISGYRDNTISGSYDSDRDGGFMSEPEIRSRGRGRGAHAHAQYDRDIGRPSTGKLSLSCHASCHSCHTSTLHRQQLGRSRRRLQEPDEEVQGEVVPGLPGRGRSHLALE